MASFPGLYRAKSVKIEGQTLTVQIPQVYGEASVAVTEFVSSVPTTVGMGYVSFRSGDAAFPVWMGVEPGTGTSTSSSPAYFTSSYEYRFNATTTAPPTNSQIRLNNAVQTLATTMWVHTSTLNNNDAHGLLLVLKAGDTLYLQDEVDSTKWNTYTLTGNPVDNTTYTTIPVIWKKGGDPLLAQPVIMVVAGVMGERILTGTGGTGGGDVDGGSSSGNLDGGTANSVYGGIPPFDAGGVT